MTNVDDSASSNAVARVSKLTVVPVTRDGFRSFAQVGLEIIRDSGVDGCADSLSINMNFNVDQMTLDQIKDIAIVHAKSLMNQCVTDPHLQVGDERLVD